LNTIKHGFLKHAIAEALLNRHNNAIGTVFFNFAGNAIICHHSHNSRRNYQVLNYFEQIKKIVVDILQVDEKEVTIESSLIDLGADSLDIVELMMEFEEHFGIEIPTKDTEKFMKLKDAIDYITARKSEKRTD